MRCDLAGESCVFGTGEDDPPQRVVPESTAVAADEQGPEHGAVDEARPHSPDVTLEPATGCRADRYQALLVAFAAHEQSGIGEINVVNVQPEQLGGTQTAAVEHLEHCAVAVPLRRAAGDVVEQAADLGM